jgi:hypothetical protein
MCKAFSCIIEPDKKVTWKMGVDSHDHLLKIAGLPNDTLDPAQIRFCRIEIAPKNGSYLEPDEWIFKIDMDVTPTWWTLDHKKACLKAHKKWLKELDKILVRKPIVHPFKIEPPKLITEEHLTLLREWTSVRASVWASVGNSVRDSVWDSVWASVRDPVWDSVGDSVGNSVGNSVRDSVGNSVRDSVWASARDSVWASVRDSVWASVWAYYGSFFALPRNEWKYTEEIKTDQYPFLSVVKLWEMGLVPSFDGKKWRLHAYSDARVVWSGTIERTQSKQAGEP